MTQSSLAKPFPSQSIRSGVRRLRESVLSLLTEENRASLRAWLVLTFSGFDLWTLYRWVQHTQDPPRSLWWLYMGARLERQQHFKAGLLGELWPGLSRTRALIATAESCLYGDRLRDPKNLAWADADANDAQIEQMMARSLYESFRDGVLFTQGWEHVFDGKGFGDQPVLAAMAKRIPKLPGRLLEIGVGGMPLYPTYRNRSEWVASDLLLGGLRILKHGLSLHQNDRLVCNDAQSLPFPDQAFHVVVSRYVIESLMRPEEMVKEVFRVLAPGGTAMLPVPPHRLVGGAELFETHRRGFFSVDEYLTLCREAGFDLIERDDHLGLYIFRKPGTLETTEWTPGYRSPDTGATDFLRDQQSLHTPNGESFPLVDGIPVFLRRALRSESLGSWPRIR